MNRETMNRETILALTGRELDAPLLTADQWDYLEAVFRPMEGYTPPAEVTLSWQVVFSLLSLARRMAEAEQRCKAVIKDNDAQTELVEALAEALSQEQARAESAEAEVRRLTTSKPGAQDRLDNLSTQAPRFANRVKSRRCSCQPHSDPAMCVGDPYCPVHGENKQ